MPSHPILLFDGVCNFCNRLVNFIIRQDRNRVFRFAPLQSEAGQKLLEEYRLPIKDIDSVILLDRGRAYLSSAAALRVCNLLPWYWKWTQLFWIVPGFVRNGLYHFIARRRYHWFGKTQQCMVPGPEVRNRFL